MYQFVFSNVFIKASSFTSESPRNKLIFKDPCKFAEIKTVRIFWQGPVQKQFEIESRFLQHKSASYFPKTNQILMILS